MGEYNVILSNCAQSDFLDLAEHMDTLPSAVATQSFESFVGRIALLEAAPTSCPLAKDAQLRLRGYRILPIDNYIVFYVINRNIVEIRRILYARRQYEGLF